MTHISTRSVTFALATLLFLGVAQRASSETIYAIGDGGASLLRFSSTKPGTVTRVATFSGGDQFLDAIDFRPATGQLYGYRDFNDSYFVVDVNTGELTSATAPSGAGATTNTFILGMDWNPTIDRMRVVTESAQNIVFNPNTGTASSVTSLFYVAGDVNEGLAPLVIENAYTNSFLGATTTQQYVLDYGLNVLATLGNNSGELRTIGEVTLGGSVLDFDDFTGFDIFTDKNGVNTAYSLLTVSGIQKLYTIDLSTGEASTFGGVGTAFGPAYSLAVRAVPEPSTLALAGTGMFVMGLVSVRKYRRKS